MGIQQTVLIESPVKYLPKQMDALKSTLEHTFTVYSGAVGAGKTILLANKAIQACLNNPGCKGIVCSLTYTQLKNVVFTVFKEEVGKYQDKLNDNSIPIRLIKHLSQTMGNMYAEFYNGSIVYFLTADDETKIRGYTIDFFLIDEPIEIDRTIFDQLVARMRGRKLITQKPFGLLATNPGAETHWIWQKFYSEGRNKKLYNHVDTNSYENTFLTKEYIQNMEESYDDDWIRRFLNGQWGAFSGQIYKEFNPDKHVGRFATYETLNEQDEIVTIEGMKREDFDYIVAGVDFGITAPCCIVVVGITKERKAIVIEEFYNNKVTSDVLSHKIADLNKKWGFRKVYCDPSNPDVIIQTQRLGVPIDKADRNVLAGISKIQSLLKKDALFVDWKCRKVISEFQAYRWEKEKLNSDEDRKPRKKDDHSMDALRYALSDFLFSIITDVIVGGITKKFWTIKNNLK